MKRLIWIAVGLIALLLFPGVVQTVSYSGVCVKCLQQVSGVDKHFLGIRYSHCERLSSGGGGLMSPAIFGPDIPRVTPDIYGEIFEEPCRHSIVRTGFCGSGGCGSYGGSQQYALRLSLIAALYRAFLKIPDRQLAGETYRLIDRFYPIVEPGTRVDRRMTSVYEVDAFPNDPLSILSRGLALVRSVGDWQTLVAAAKQGNGQIPMLDNREALVASLRDADPVVRMQALKCLAARNEPEAWEAVASTLADPEIGREAGNLILWNKDFSHFEEVLAMWATPADNGYGVGGEDIELNEFAKQLKPSEIQTLLSRREPLVDQLCLKSIEMTDRFEFLREALAVLNERSSRDAIRTINHLLAGNYPDLFRDASYQPVRSPWQWLQDQRRDVLRTTPRRPTDQILREAMELGWSRESGAWEKWESIFDRWIREHAAEGFAAAFAEAMYAIDPSRTVNYLNAKLDQADEAQWDNDPSCVLVGMGTVASPKCLPAIERFVKKTKGSNFDTHPYYRGKVDYALHRSRQIQNWQLVKNEKGRYVVLKTDGSVID